MQGKSPELHNRPNNQEDQLERPRAGREEEVSLVCRRTTSEGFPNTLPQLLVVLATGSVSQQ